jgi:hypothetical protein
MLIAQTRNGPVPLPEGLGYSMRPRKRRSMGDALTYLPAGSQLLYTVQWGASFMWSTPQQIAAAISSDLQNNYGIMLQGIQTAGGILNESGITQPNGFTATVSTTRDYGTANDVQSVINGDLINIAGVTPAASSISVVSSPQPIAASVSPNAPPAAGLPGAATLPAATSTTSVTDWLTTNWWVLAAIGVLGLISVL